MTSMVERVAEALWQEDSLRAAGRRRLIPWREENEGERSKFFGFARAAIAEMREPTEGMEDAGRDYIEDDKTGTLPIYASVVFGLMIDAALEEKP